MPNTPSPPAELQAAQAAIDEGRFLSAIALLEPLCTENNAAAKSMLGVLYQLGLGVPINGPKAVSLLAAAAEAGIGIAAHNLGTIYVTGLPGVAPDPELSQYFYRLAKNLGAQFAPDAFYEKGI